MKKRYSNPGVYVEEISAFPKTIAQVETAIPAFIGYTEKAFRGSSSLLNIPTRISSMLEFEEFFGGAFPSRFEVVSAVSSDPLPFTIEGQMKSLLFLPDQQVFLYYSIKAFFSNGGSSCYIVSVGNYVGQATLQINKSDLLNGLSVLESEETPSVLAIPDAVLLGDDAFEVYQAMLAQAKSRFRFAILDIPNGFLPLNTSGDCISNFRNRIGNMNLASGAAYYPWLYSNLGSDRDFEILNHIPLQDLQEILPEEFAKTFLNTSPSPSGEYLHQALKSLSPTYLKLQRVIQEKLGLLPPSGFLAGAYALVDNSRGVWKAPANISLNSVRSTSFSISNSIQEDLNIHPSGKSINAIREFPGKGVLVWGARTLAGNDNEWRYVPVRRTFNMIEHSIRNGLQYVVFEPNEPKTWTRVKSECTNFLFGIWRSGGIAGAKPEDAFFIKVGLGETMTSQDILDDNLNVEIGMALVRPAEFMFLRIKLKTGSH
ncbi:phage tail sheath family protein [Algoriphagus marinus]|uniref:phage tail sheath family protein n=1 Tax=Algoriphagus marinus TaxID=1925762 RepID=UPI0009F9F484|nr:phage tail sheath C-terminal domain-containing protein [Algoriphagus marinus]